MRNGFWLSKEANDVSDDGDYELLVHWRGNAHGNAHCVLHICINILSTAFISTDTYIQLRAEDEDVQKCFLRY